MANVKISELPTLATPQATGVFPVSFNGTTSKLAVGLVTAGLGVAAGQINWWNGSDHAWTDPDEGEVRLSSNAQALQFGSNPSSITATLRGSNDFRIASRLAGGTAVSLMHMTPGDQLILGDDDIPNTRLQAATDVRFEAGGVGNIVAQVFSDRLHIAEDKNLYLGTNPGQASSSTSSIATGNDFRIGSRLAGGTLTSLMWLTTGDDLILGHAVIPRVLAFAIDEFQAAVGGQAVLRVFDDSITMAPVGGTTLSVTETDVNVFKNTLRFAQVGTVTAPQITHQQNTANDATGLTLLVRAQPCTGTDSIGGNLHLDSGGGVQRPGHVELRVGGTTALMVRGDGSVIESHRQFFDFEDSVSAPTIRHQAETGVGVDGETFTVQAQNATGAGADGGPLHLTSGTGDALPGDLNLQVGGVDQLTFSGQAPIAEFSTKFVQFGSSVSGPTIRQTNEAGDGVNGDDFLIQAQNASGDGSTGGTLKLRAGTGVTAPGEIDLDIGGASRMTVADTFVQVAVPLLTFTSGQVTPTIQQNSDDANGITGDDLVVAAQSCTGTTATGGRLLQRSGAGTASDGNIEFQTGTTRKLVISGASSVLEFHTAIAQFDQTMVAPVIRQEPDATNDITGDDLIFQAQNTTGTNTTGGRALIRSGTGTAADGNVELQNGTSRGMLMTPIAMEIYRRLQFDEGHAAPLIQQEPNDGNGITGEVFTVHSQDATHATDGTGGDMVQRAGVGPTANGSWKVLDGSAEMLVVGPGETFGAFGADPIAQPTVSGTDAQPDWAASLLTALNDLGWITDSTAPA